jgi:HEAT repeat protein
MKNQSTPCETMLFRSQRNTLSKPHRPSYAGTAIVCLAFVVSAGSSADGVETPWVMYEDPMLLKAPIETSFPPELVDRWLQALARPEREMKRRAALAIAQGVSKGVPGLEATIDPLCDVLKDPGQDRIVRLSAAHALVALDARRAAPMLIEATSPMDLDMAEVVEPALARWADPGLRDRWVERLNADIGLRRFHELAIRGVAALGEEEAIPRLLELALDRDVPVSVRFEAADALGVMRDSGLLGTARELSQDQSFAAVVDRVVAARMIAGHRGEETEAFLIGLATEPQPALRSIALGHLFRLDPSLILPIIGDTVRSNDANVRRWGAEALVARPSIELLEVLVPMLDDHDPEIRRYVCDSLVALAENPVFHETILRQGKKVLNADSWRGQEQATLLLVTLEDTTIVDRLIELLDMSRREANVTAAWGLCILAVPATAEPVHDVLRRKTESWLAGEPQQDGIDDQLALLAQMLGVLKHAPAESVLHMYIAKGTNLEPTSRSAAIWALGKIRLGETDPQLAKLLVARVLDAFSMEPEFAEVCRMSAITLARIQASSAVGPLRSTLEQASLQSELGYACAWAIAQLTGGEIPPLEPAVDWQRDWFLVPAAQR